MRKSMVILLLAWWLVAPAWGAELPREVRDALPAAAEEITEELELSLIHICGAADLRRYGKE